MKLPILYKYTTRGQKQQWQIIVDGSTFYTEEGIVDGVITRNKPTQCIGKNIGKRNETFPEEQAIIEAKAKHEHKLARGYGLTLESSGKRYFSPMLAETYKDKDTKKTYSWVEKIMSNKEIKKFVQPKYDGIRCINSNEVLTSRDGKFFITCPHLHQKGVILDGELYNHIFKDNFNEIVSIIKQPKATEEDIEKAKQFAKMYVYDMPSVEGTFSERYKALKEWFKNLPLTNKNKFVLVPTYEVHNEEEMLSYHERFISEGYEGTMIRVDNANYEQKRSKQLIKYKDFIDEEFEIVGFEEGKGGRIGTIGKFILKHDKVASQTFECDVKGNHEYLRKVWKNREEYIGKEATVQYKKRTPKKEKGGDVPQFAKIIKLDRKSYE